MYTNFIKIKYKIVNNQVWIKPLFQVLYNLKFKTLEEVQLG